MWCLLHEVTLHYIVLQFIEFLSNTSVYLQQLCQSVLKDTRRYPYPFLTYRKKAVIVFIARRVHITSVTLEHLNGAYKVEDGDGQERDPYLKEHGVITYLVINPKVQQQHPLHIQ